MKTYIFIALAMLCHTAGAQDDDRPTIYFNDGKTLTAEKIRLRTGAFNDLYLLSDGKQIQADQIKFFQNDRGFFANLKPLDPMRISGFAIRTDKGRINLYKEMPRRYEWENRYDGYQHPHEADYGADLYYNKGMGNLKRISYANLLADLKDNRESLDFLAAYRKKRNAANIFLGVAGASLLASFVIFVSDGRNTPSRAFASSRPLMPSVSYGLMGVGAGFGLVGALKYMNSRNEMMNAIDAYNR